MANKRVSEMTDAEVQALASPPGKDTRISLNITPETYRELIRWADSAAVPLEVPRIAVQDAIRAMIRGTLDSTPATTAAMKALRKERQGRAESLASLKQ